MSLNEKILEDKLHTAMIGGCFARLPEVSKFSERRSPGNKPDDLGLKERTLIHGRNKSKEL